jgi:hypothetical protein
MRIRTVIGIAVAGGAAAAVAGIGGTALAAGPGGTDPAVHVIMESPAATPEGSEAGSAEQRDCPEKDGSGSGTGTGTPAPAGAAGETL